MRPPVVSSPEDIRLTRLLGLSTLPNYTRKIYTLYTCNIEELLRTPAPASTVQRLCLKLESAYHP
jgi:hypothetical protein